MKKSWLALTVLLTALGCSLVRAPASPLAQETSLAPAGYPGYRNSEFSFGLDLPPDAILDFEKPSYLELDDYVHVTLTVTPGTTLSRKDLQVTVVRGANPCVSPHILNLNPETQSVDVNGLPFLKQTGVGAAAGTTTQAAAYSTSRDGVCVTLIFALHSFDPANLDPSLPSPRAFDLAGESAIFDSILSTFAWD